MKHSDDSGTESVFYLIVIITGLVVMAGIAWLNRYFGL